jgi:formate hydrogenlyase subunit 4
VFGALLVGLVLPIRTGSVAADLAIAVGGLMALGIVVGVIESTMARLRLVRVPHLLAAAGAMACLALILVWR